jgi:UPF0755 protein
MPAMIAPGRRTTLSIALVLACCLLSLLAWYLVCLLLPVGRGRVVRVVSLPEGSGVARLAQELKQGGIIRSSWHFILVSRLRGQAQRLKAGEYRFSDAMTTTEILAKVVEGRVDFRRFTLPEGYSTYQAAELLERKGLLGRDEFLAACRDPRLLARLGIGTASVEGYLFPATYNLSRGESASQLVSRMTAQFEKNYAAMAGRAAGTRSRHAVVTMASMIEKEAVFPIEKPLISSVFHNRLAMGMRLQSDPTAVYGVRAFGGTVSSADIRRHSPYNTYLHRGLPPGPIGNPGADALAAALHPAATPYLYFVARQDGTHHFSRTLGEHNRAVQRYLK